MRAKPFDDYLHNIWALVAIHAAWGLNEILKKMLDNSFVGEHRIKK
jgi:hypothetical protein|tara:strand:- start:427 stop:564 length:138 start_codon:yes stop_codon:yes gene_type:complete